MAHFDIYIRDVLDFLEHDDSPNFSFALYDPPYEINHVNRDWDRSGIAYDPKLYSGIYNRLLPGAFACFYSYARTHHRMMVAAEDAGFIIHKTQFAWVYASGNPLGAKNAQRKIDDYFVRNFGGICKCDNPINSGRTVKGYINPMFEAIADAIQICTNCDKPIRIILGTKQWGNTGGMKLVGGHGYGNNNTQIFAKSMTVDAEIFKAYSYGLAWSKPMLEPVICVQKPFDTPEQAAGITQYGTGVVNVHNARHTDRWPGNFIAIHDPDCEQVDGRWICNCGIGDYVKSDHEFYDKIPTFGYDDIDTHLAFIDSLLYDKKPSQKERNAGLNHKNNHPSVKPISVNKYLGELFLPPPEYAPRRAFVPFSGSGSEIVGLLHAGWDEVVGVETGADYAFMSLERTKALVNDKVSYWIIE